VSAAIGGVSGLGIAVAASPIPVVAMILLLATDRARINGLFFELGWTAGLAVLGFLALKVLGSSASSSDDPAGWRAWGEIGLGCALLLLSAQQFRRRPAPTVHVPTPAWMDALDGATPARALGLGVVVAVANPKTAALTVSAGGVIAAADAGFGGEVLALGAFVVIAAIGVTVPLALFLIGGRRAAPRLARWRVWLTRNNAAVVAVLALVLGLYLALSGIRAIA
jgi:threonine/homoserine/homoserine lactone efflux protein